MATSHGEAQAQYDPFKKFILKGVVKGFIKNDHDKFQFNSGINMLEQMAKGELYPYLPNYILNHHFSKVFFNLPSINYLKLAVFVTDESECTHDNFQTQGTLEMRYS
jgi:hypothetical protein